MKRTINELAAHRRDTPRVGMLAMLAAAALWGTTGTAQAIGGIDDVLATGSARLVGGGGLLLLIALSGRSRSWVRRCWSTGLWGWTLLGSVAAGIFQLVFFAAVASTGVTVGTLVALGIAPVATAAAAAIAFGERPHRRWWLATTVAAAGTALLVAPIGGTVEVEAVGVAFAVVAGCCYGAYTIAAKALLDRQVPVLAALGATLGGAAICTSPLLLTRMSAFATVSGLVTAIWLAVATTTIAYLLFAAGVGRLPASTVGTLALAEPLTATALGFVLLGERLDRPAALGAGLLLVGLWLAARRPTGQPHDLPPTAATERIAHGS